MLKRKCSNVHQLPFHTWLVVCWVGWLAECVVVSLHANASKNCSRSQGFALKLRKFRVPFYAPNITK